MEAAAIISIALLDYADFAVRTTPIHLIAQMMLTRTHAFSCLAQLIVALLTANACIGFYEDQNAGNAIAELAAQLAPKCKVAPETAAAAICTPHSN